MSSAMPPKSTLSLASRFWAKVNKNAPVVRPDLGPCWLWTASRNEFGYGKFAYRDRTGKQHCARAHRYAWELINGAIPSGAFLLHQCDVKACVRPDHLRIGDRDQNTAEAIARGRIAQGAQHWARRLPGTIPRGEQRYNAKLTAAQAQTIRIRYASGGVTQAALGRTYGITRESVRDILRGRNWKHV
jgi:hypothetical protein